MSAITKIKTEMSQNSNNPYIQVVGEFLLRHLEHDPGVEEKILAADKTIAKSLEAMEREARKKKVGNMAVLTDQEGFAIVLKYFGIEAEAAPIPVEVKQEEVKKPAPSEQKPQVDFDIKLDDFL